MSEDVGLLKATVENDGTKDICSRYTIIKILSTRDVEMYLVPLCNLIEEFGSIRVADGAAFKHRHHHQGGEHPPG